MAPLPISAEEASSPEARSDQRLLLVVAVVVTVLDLFSKWSISRYFEDDDHESSIELIGSTITLRLSENDGIAFGLFQNQSVIVGSIVALGVLALVVVGWRTAAFGGSMIAVSFGLLIGGAFGNLLDRLSDGHVTDFVVVGPWPSFNLADSAITVGAILLILWLLLDRRATPTGVK